MTIMRHLFVYLFVLFGLSHISAENKPKPVEEPTYFVYLFISKCDMLYTITSNHELSDSEYSYIQGYFDGLCDRGIGSC